VAPIGAFALTLFGACGGGSSAPMSSTPPAASAPAACTASTCGSAMTTMTDAAGDFLTYQVNLVSLQLKRADGTLVETLPATTTIDLVQLVDLTEILSARQVPAGEYVAAQVTVDYSNANIMADDGSGNAVTLAAVDSTGAALGRLQLTIQLDAKNHLEIDAAKVGRIAFDFNLLASNMVDLTARTVAVTPVLVASVVAADAKPIRVRGELVSVDSASGSYTVNVDPFQEHHDDKQSPLVVHTTGTTTFEINGAPFAGAAGLDQLAKLPGSTLIVAFGTLSTADRTFTASGVLAGSSVAGVAADHISGSVVARSGDSLTLHAAELDDHGGDHDFVPHDVTVSIADATAVTAAGQASAAPAHTIAEISVGSLIDAFGSASRDASGHVTLDATVGRVRLDLTRVQGRVVASGSGELTVSLSAIDRQPATLFNFTGTGATVGADSNPASYVLATHALDLTSFTLGSSMLGIGLVSPFGAAPPDFSALTLAQQSAGNDGDDNDQGDGSRGKGAQLDIDWGKSGTSAPFKALDAQHLDLDVDNASIGGHHRIQVDPQDVDIRSLTSDPSIVGAASSTTQFSITREHGGDTDNFHAFSDFEAALAQDLDGTTKALRMTAQGQYDAATNVFTARSINIQLGD
jgi:hypothetical protein